MPGGGCRAGSLEVYPTGAIIRTEFDSAFIQPDVCNGCRNCIAACPYNVISLDEHNGVVQKCTLCYDRLQGGLEPACAKACPTESIQFGPVDQLRQAARQRVTDLHEQGVPQARLYGEDSAIYGGLNAFFLLMDEPAAYRLPDEANAVLPRRNNLGGYLGALGTAVLAVFGGLIALRRRREPVADGPAEAPAEAPAGAPETGAGEEWWRSMHHMARPASLANAQAFAANPVSFYRKITGGEDGYRAVVPFDMFGPNLLVNDPELVRAVLLSPDGGDFGKNGLRFFMVLRRMLGLSVFTVDGDRHRRKRRLVQPILRPRSLGAATEAMTRAARRLRDDWAGGGKRVVDVPAAASRTALDLLAEAFAGERRAAEVRELAELTLAAEDPLLHVLKAPVVFPARLPTPANRRLSRASRALHERATEVLRSSVAVPPAPGSLLAHLLAQGQAAGTSEADLVDELVTLVVAGHQSTAAAIAFTFYALAANIGSARLVEREAAGVLGGRPATAADLPHLRHARMVVDEALRMYPPVWIITRRAADGTELGGRMLRTGTVVHICPYTLHRNPAYWPEPDRFRPERFADGGAGTGERHRFAYAPFGGGPYKCVGNHFALMATVIVVATVGAAVRFAAPSAEVTVSARSFTVAENGLPLTIDG